MDHKYLYLKYKTKYLELKYNMTGGARCCPNNCGHNSNNFIKLFVILIAFAGYCVGIVCAVFKSINASEGGGFAYVGAIIQFKTADCGSKYNTISLYLLNKTFGVVVSHEFTYVQIPYVYLVEEGFFNEFAKTGVGAFVVFKFICPEAKLSTLENHVV